MAGNVDCNKDATHLRDENNANRTTTASTSAIGMCRHLRCLVKDGTFGVVVMDGSNHDALSGHGANGRGGITSWGGGAMTTMKVKNNDDVEANATMTITTTLETTMTDCVVDDGNCGIINC